MSNWSVIGSGVTGLCVATMLCEYNETVEVIESSDVKTASLLAGGMLAPFCEGESAPDIVVEYGMTAIEWWSNHVSSVKKTGTLVLAPARDTVELKNFASKTQSHTWVAPESLESDLSNRFSQGLFFPEEAHLDPRLSLKELRSTLIEKGVVFHTNKPSGKIVDCTGISAEKTLPNLRAVRGEMLIFESHDVSFSRSIRLLHPRFPCYLVPRHNGQFMLGATMVESHDDSSISAKALIEMLGSAYAIHPAFAEARLVETGTGLRPSFPNNVPEITYQDGCFFINGMYRHGFLLAPYMAQQFVKKL
ncbi:Glycine/D-amino acid oxidase (deaminating) (DadA) (PDB:3AWI) [Commensalibacter communis]|uniref:FAD-dependent oxidoreductase n=1 Tax=Commensalibacter communis TaxID=2972786 RepID=UPI0022FFC37B|nr:FAD-dependent oxidoreductase [Commensalibacter communis]CAI3943643.1 Glycine/D-amino acid oxidase (deaminating) (DadA) (PDB:3AWI) [Commensalibacter communis]